MKIHGHFYFLRQRRGGLGATHTAPLRRSQAFAWRGVPCTHQDKEKQEGV